MAFERVISCIFTSQSKDNNSLYGNFLEYWKCDANKININGIVNKNLPILKVWSGR